MKDAECDVPHGNESVINHGNFNYNGKSVLLNWLH